MMRHSSLANLASLGSFMGTMGSLLIALTLSAAASTAASAAVPDSVVATQACPAYQSIKKHANPGKVALVKGRAYPVRAGNRQPPTYYQIEIAGAHPAERWVAVSCVAAAPRPAPTPAPVPTPTPTPAPNPGPSPTPLPSGPASDLLALSWQPAFCETKPDKTECQAETAQSPDAHQLSLHGLWPEPNGTFYCNVPAAVRAHDQPGQWDQLPDPGLQPATRARLSAVMPGTRSLLERHEWIKHGTCFGTSADVYFNRAADLVEQVDASALGALIAANVGKVVSTAAMEDAFARSFGESARGALVVKCQSFHGVAEIIEIDLYLGGDVAGNGPLGPLLRKPPGGSSCASGRLAPAAH